MARKNKEQWNNKSPEYNTQKFDTDINQKMYCGTNTSRAVITLAPKQSFEDVLQNRCSSKFRKFHRKTTMFESLLNKAAGFQAFIKMKP